MAKKSLKPSAVKRLAKEDKDLQKESEDRLFTASPKMINGYPDYSTWIINFTLHDDNSLYKDKIIEAEMYIPEDYPFSPPEFKFVTDMFHPNIYPDGNICISILEKDGPGPLGCGEPQEKWSPVQSIRTILLSIVVLLDNPNPDSPANVDACKVFRFDFDTYKQIVRSTDCTRKKYLVSKALMEINKK